MSAPERILVVDDELHVVNFIQAEFERNGHEVTVARDGREALAILENQDFDRVYLDVMMPYVDGFEVLKWIRAHPTKKSTWVAFMTPQADNLDTYNREWIGADHYVPKPFTAKDLLP